MTKRNSSSHVLTPLHRAILEFVSSKGPATSEKIRSGLQARHPLTDSSMRTILRRLEARGLLSHTVEGKMFMYRAEVAPTRVAADAVKRLIQGFWAGSAERFLAGLVDEKVLSGAEIERLAKKVRGRK